MDLRSLLDPKTRFVFLSGAGLTRAYHIAHVTETVFYLTSPTEISDELESGHALAANGAGILIFEKPKLEAMPSGDDVILYRIDMANLNFSISNRRLYARYEFSDYQAVAFSHYGELVVGRMANIGEGGLRLMTDRPIQSNVVCRFEIRLSADFVFITDGVVVYSDWSDETEKQAIVGISFVAPNFTSEADKQTYVLAKHKLSDLIRGLRVAL
jgi:hypothetical protein